jgi:hypothetical protein
MVAKIIIALALVVAITFPNVAHSMQLGRSVFRKLVLKSTVAISSFGLMVNTASAEMITAPFDDKIRYEVVETGKGDQPKVGEIVSIRFKASYKGKDFDNTFDNPQPYMYRAG